MSETSRTEELNEFFVGQRVLVRNLRDGPRWLQGTVIERKGPLSYLVQLTSGTVWRRHIDHMLESVDSPLEETVTPEPVTPELEELPRFPLSPSTPVPSPTVPVAEQPAISTDKASAPEHSPESLNRYRHHLAVIHSANVIPQNDFMI